MHAQVGKILDKRYKEKKKKKKQMLFLKSLKQKQGTM